MAFTFTVDKHRNVNGDNYVVTGKFTNTDGDTGGTIATGLHLVKHFDLQYTGAAAIADAASVNENFPSDGSVIIVTAANSSGIWKAIGA